MFPTTIWTTIQKAGEADHDALERFAARYRTPVLRYIAARGFDPGDADDLCQDVFARILGGGVLARADAQRGRFRSLVLTIAFRVIQDRLRRRPEPSLGAAELGFSERDPAFDREWILHLAERSMVRLREQGSPYYEVLRGHLDGEPQNRNKLWIARKKLSRLIRDEVAFTCRGETELADELAYLARFLRPEDSAQNP